MRKLRIVQVTNLQESVPPLNKNGLEQVVSYLTEELVKMGHEVTLFATGDSKTTAKLVPFWPEALSRSPYRKALYPGTLELIAVSEAIRCRGEFDIIHGHLRLQLAVFGQFIDTPLVTTVHHPISKESVDNLPAPYHQPYQKIWHEQKKHLHTVVVSHFQAKNYDLPCTVIPNGIPVNNWPFVNSSGDYLAFLGYITPDKGVSQAIQAVLPTKEKLIIAGPILEDDKESQTYFQEEVQPFLSERIKFIGPLNHEEKIKFLSNAKATLMPIQWDEPFGMVAIESLACGTPVIAWNRAAMPEIIEDGVSGYLVNSVEEMTQKIGQINKLDRKNCRKRVEENFTVQKMAENYVNLYNQIISK